MRIGCIGECMIELSRIDLADGRARIGFAGDTMNTAIYLARRCGGGSVDYVTLLGTDAFSHGILDMLAVEGVGTQFIGRHPDRLPGIYAIETDAAGERSFRYWRENSAARLLFGGIGATLDDLAAFDVIYLSGITLAILPPHQRSTLIARLGALKDEGRRIVFDTNYRRRLWPDETTAREAFDAMWRATSIALPSRDDEAKLWPGLSAEAIVERIAKLGLAEIVLKDGDQGPLLWSGDAPHRAALPRAKSVVDTTGAGDSFNAGYLAARLAGAGPVDAAASGHRLAATVIGHHGAIIARAAMPDQGSL
ncbi:MAG: hypothetical protein DI533_06155 [Cereibacter sphaeroides]|uniref:2-dehydro-3-deoxygluconokinase n=1 Tax=Cereibacter sphaeroides TaxID=1063 RepID=A0A2W5SD25_CERSP|nr:MAG: hypothetical protein DI533_06155 [Cereibacter sphaeroides]